VRVTIDEIAGERPRFRPDDALNGEPKLLKSVAPSGHMTYCCSFKSPSKGGGSVSLLTGDGHKLVLHYRPFRIDVYSGKDDLVVSLNSQQLLKIEHFRTRLVLVVYRLGRIPVRCRPANENDDKKGVSKALSILVNQSITWSLSLVNSHDL